MQKRFSVILDCDDVLFQCNEYALKKLNEETGSSYQMEDIREWGIGAVLSGIDERLKFFSNPRFVNSQPPIEGAREFVSALSKKAEILVATSVPASCAGARVNSILRTFPEIRMENILIGNRKDALQADMLLDDAVHHIKASRATYPVLFRRPWNEDYTSGISVSTYAEFLALVDLILQTPGEMSMADGPKVVCLVGPSGSGKTYLSNRLIRNGLCSRVISTTTRARRENEPETAYRFVSRETFLEMEKAGRFFETAAYMGERYGSSRDDVDAILASGDNAIAVLDINGALAMKAAYREKAVLVFVNRQKADCIRSILQRGLPLEESVKRIDSLDAEFRNRELCDITVTSSQYLALTDILKGGD